MRHRRIVVEHYGGPEELRVVEEDCPEPKAGEVRVRVLAVLASYEDDDRSTADKDLCLIRHRCFAAPFADIVGRRLRGVSQHVPSRGGCGRGRQLEIERLPVHVHRHVDHVHPVLVPSVLGHRDAVECQSAAAR